MKHQFPPTGCGVNIFRDAFKPDPSVVELRYCFNEERVASNSKLERKEDWQKRACLLT